MNRKIFLIELWNRYLRPVLLLIMAYFVVQFLIVMPQDNGADKYMRLAIMALVVLYALAYIFGKVLLKIMGSITIQISEKLKFKLRILGKIGAYMALLALGALYIKLWEKDAFIALVFILLHLIDKLNTIVKEERLKLKDRD